MGKGEIIVSLFKKKPSGFDEQEKQGAAKSSGSIIVLLILLAGFAYLYFFTSLIVPHEPPAPAKAPEVVTVVKQSMPPKPADQPATPAPADAEKPEEAKPAALPAPPPTTATPAVPAPVPATVKPAASAAVPKPQAAAKPAAALPKKDAVPAQKAEPKPAKAVEPKPAPAVQKAAEAKSVKAPVPAEKKPVVIKKPETYTLFAGEFSAGDEAIAAEAKLAMLGIKPVIRKEIKKSIRMNRLFYGAYTDYDVYAAELDKLRQVIKSAFGVEKNGTYSIYAGSFAARDRVEKEKKDLSAKGVTLQIQPTVLSLATVKLTAGMFSSKKEADKAAAKMKGAGLAAKVVSQRR